MHSVVLDWLDVVIFCLSASLVVETDGLMLKNLGMQYVFEVTMFRN